MATVVTMQAAISRSTSTKNNNNTPRSSAPTSRSILDYYLQSRRSQMQTQTQTHTDQRVDAILMLGQQQQQQQSSAPVNMHVHSHQPMQPPRQLAPPQQQQQQQLRQQQEMMENTIGNNDTFQRVDSSDWFDLFNIFVPLRDGNTNANIAISQQQQQSASSNSNANFTYSAFTSSSSQTNSNYRHNVSNKHQLQQRPQVQSVKADDFLVVSDRLAAIMPELERTSGTGIYNNNDGVSNEDASQLLFANPDSWMNSLNNQTQCQIQPMDATLALPSLMHSTSLSNVSDTTSHSSNNASTCSKPHSSNSEKSCNFTKNKTKKKRPTKTAPPSMTKRKLGRPSAFPHKLYRMLTELENTCSSLCQVVSFTDQGASFQIHDNEAFVTQVLPQFFKMSSFGSFQRQLQLYNFKRISKGGPYQHVLFHRDQPENVGKMVRKQSRPSSMMMKMK